VNWLLCDGRRYVANALATRKAYLGRQVSPQQSGLVPRAATISPHTPARHCVALRSMPPARTPRPPTEPDTIYHSTRWDPDS